MNKRYIDLRSIVLAASLVLVSACATHRDLQGALTFSAVGDGPRADADWAILEDHIARVDRDGRSAFLIHLGDITKGADALPESYYVRVAELLETSKTPVLIVPGDNEWNDLDDPARGWEFWNRHFLAFDKRWPTAPVLQRQESHPENFSFEQNGVLVIGLNLVGGTVHDPVEWAQRHQDSAAFVAQSLQHHPDVHALVVCAQARPNIEKHEDFFGPFCELAAEFGKSVLYIHGDGHVYERENAWRNSNITRIQVDQVSKGPPVTVVITPDRKTVFRILRLAPPKKDRMRRPNHFGPSHRGFAFGHRSGS
jgi:hypothetical protein